MARGVAVAGREERRIRRLLHPSRAGRDALLGRDLRPGKPALHALRTAFAEDGAEARRFDRILAAKALRPYLPLDTEPLRVTPRGFPKQHRRLTLIRARNYLVRRDICDDELRRCGAFAVFRDAIRACAPFVRWLDERVRPPDTGFSDDDDFG